MRAFLPFIAALLLFAGPSHAAEFIRVGSFNIANFGDTNEYERSLLSLVNIIRQILAEGESDGG